MIVKKKVMILLFLCLWLQSANLCQNPPKRWTKPNLTALTLQRMLMIEREGGAGFQFIGREEQLVIYQIDSFGSQGGVSEAVG